MANVTLAEALTNVVIWRQVSYRSPRSANDRQALSPTMK